MLWLLIWAASSAADDADAWNAERGRRLAEKLRNREGPVIVVLGDSLTWGMGVQARRINTFHSVFEQVLVERYNDPKVCVFAVGVPGETSSGALRRFQDDVASRRPDLVVLQFGGNDHGWGRTEEEYRRDLGELIARVRDETDAACIVCAPPIVSVGPMPPFVEAAVDVGRKHGAVVADLDSAIRLGDHDYRGSFPHGTHPGAFTHVIMAKELSHAFDELVRSEPALAVNIVGGVRLVEPGEAAEVEVQITNTSGESRKATLLVDRNGLSRRRRLDLGPGAAKAFPITLDAPPRLHRGKSLAIRLMVIAASEGSAAFDVKWATFAPVIHCPLVDSDDAAAPTRTLGPECLTVGAEAWRGPDDLSGSFRVTRRGERVQVTVTVRDDDVSPQTLRDAPLGDAVELYVDARDAADQGKPVYDDRVFGLFVLPRAKGRGKAEWGPLDAPAPDDGAIRATSERRPDGYEVTAFLPVELLRKLSGGDLSAIGFDVGVDDADGAAYRKSQMMWAGTRDNYVDASRFAALHFGEDDGNLLRMTVR